jgi:hypothetical protein
MEISPYMKRQGIPDAKASSWGSRMGGYFTFME